MALKELVRPQHEHVHDPELKGADGEQSKAAWAWARARRPPDVSHDGGPPWRLRRLGNGGGAARVPKRRKEQGRREPEARGGQ